MQSTLALQAEDGKSWHAPSEAEARLIVAALDRSHMLVLPPAVTTRTMGVRDAGELFQAVGDQG